MALGLDIEEYVTPAAALGVSLASRRVRVDPRLLSFTDRIDEWRVRRYAKVLRASYPAWPATLPFVVFGENRVGCEYGSWDAPNLIIFDGNHRVKAALRAGFDVIPALEIDYRAWRELAPGIPRGFWVAMLANIDKRLARNDGLISRTRKRFAEP